MAERLRRLALLTSELGAAVTIDDVARVALAQVLDFDGVVRAGLALSQGAGREVRFVSTDDEALGSVSVRWCSIDGLEDVPVAHTIRTGQPMWLLEPADIERAFPGLAPRQLLLGTVCMASVPLMIDESCAGALLVSLDRELLHTPEQKAYLLAVAAQLAQAVKRGLAYQVQHSTSEQLQRSLMPHSLPEVAGLAIGSHYQAGGLNVDVGGDWFDVLHLDDGSVALTLGDVMGKGVPAAIVMSEVRSATRAYALLDPDPAVVLARLDDVVAQLQVPEQVVTMLYGVIDPLRTRLTLGVAGHPPPLLVAPSGRPQVLDAEHGPALGIGLDKLDQRDGLDQRGLDQRDGLDKLDPQTGRWPSVTVPLEDDATVLFYSDGLVETRRQSLLQGLDKLLDRVEVLAPRRRNPRELCARLSELMSTGDAEDDVTILAVTAAPAQLRATEELPADPRAAGLARRFVSAALRDWLVDDDIVATAELCVSELVTNAVIHSGTTSSVTVQVDEDYVLVLVQDHGGRGSVRLPEELDPQSVSGRGLSLVDALASAWAAEHSTDGTTVWFELALSGADATTGPFAASY